VQTNAIVADAILMRSCDHTIVQINTIAQMRSCNHEIVQIRAGSAWLPLSISLCESSSPIHARRSMLAEPWSWVHARGSVCTEGTGRQQRAPASGHRSSRIFTLRDRRDRRAAQCKSDGQRRIASTRRVAATRSMNIEETESVSQEVGVNASVSTKDVSQQLRYTLWWLPLEGR